MLLSRVTNCCTCTVLLYSFFHNTLQYFIENPTILLRITAVYAVSSHRFSRYTARHPWHCHIDTCHVYDAGYDIVNDLDGVLKQFDEIIGIDRLYAIHINDSKNPFESHKDRHEKIGEGSIGTEAFERIINHPMLADKPFFLETPNELDGYAKEIALLKSLRRE